MHSVLYTVLAYGLFGLAVALVFWGYWGLAFVPLVIGGTIGADKSKS